MQTECPGLLLAAAHDLPAGRPRGACTACTGTCREGPAWHAAAVTTGPPQQPRPSTWPKEDTALPVRLVLRLADPGVTRHPLTRGFARRPAVALVAEPAAPGTFTTRLDGLPRLQRGAQPHPAPRARPLPASLCPRRPGLFPAPSFPPPSCSPAAGSPRAAQDGGGGRGPSGLGGDGLVRSWDRGRPRGLTPRGLRASPLPPRGRDLRDPAGWGTGRSAARHCPGQPGLAGCSREGSTAIEDPESRVPASEPLGR